MHSTLLLRCLVAFTALFASVLVARAEKLRIDFNYRGNDLPATTQEDYDSFIVTAVGGTGAIQPNPTTLQFGTIAVTLSRIGGNGFDDRRTATITNSATFTNAPILRDWIFNQGATTTGSGMSIRVQGLASNQTHQITIWCFATNAATLVSDWYANGVLVKDNYSFNGAVLPVSNSDYHFTFSATANASGEILIEGKRDSSSASGNPVMLCGLEIDNIPQQGPLCGTSEHLQPGSNLYGWTAGDDFAEQDQEVAALKAIGVKWARINVVWHEVESTQKGSYNSYLLGLYDNLMQRLNEAGIKVIFVTAQSPYWASNDPFKTNGIWNAAYKPANNSDLADYYLFLLNRYRSTGPHVYEIWNEQNATNFWPLVVNAAEYTAMLQTCYTAIKAADPQAIVLNGGLVDAAATTAKVTDTTDYMNAMYDAGAKNYFDAWSQHTYTKTPQYETIVSDVRNIMVARGDSAKKIWMTEIGWYTYPGDSGGVSFARQAHYLTNFFTRLATYPEVEVALWYTSRSYDENLHEGSFGLMLPDFTPKPSYYAYKDWVTAASRHCFPAFLSLSAPTFLPDGSARLEISADPQFTYTLQASGNFTQWTNIATNLGSMSNSFTFDDTAAAANSNRFYRVRW